jgi:hypothetical protein
MISGCEGVRYLKQRGAETRPERRVGRNGGFEPIERMYGVDWRTSRLPVCAELAKHTGPGKS